MLIEGKDIPFVQEITAGQAILLALIGGIAIISWIYSFMISMRALIVAAFVGAVLGHAKEAIIFGAAAEILYLGLINAAGVIPPNPVGPGMFGTVIYLTNLNMSIGTAIALSFPFAIFIQFLVTIIFTIVSPVGKVSESLIRKEKWLLWHISGHTTGILLFILGAAIGLGAGLGYDSFNDMIKQIPEWLQDGLSVGGKMLPAMGFAIILRLMLKKEYMPFLFVGFALVVIFQGIAAAKPEWGFSLVALAITAVAIAMVTFYSGMLAKQESKRAQAAPVGGEEDGI